MIKIFENLFLVEIWVSVTGISTNTLAWAHVQVPWIWERILWYPTRPYLLSLLKQITRSISKC